MDMDKKWWYEKTGTKVSKDPYSDGWLGDPIVTPPAIVGTFTVMSPILAAFIGWFSILVSIVILGVYITHKHSNKEVHTKVRERYSASNDRKFFVSTVSTQKMFSLESEETHYSRIDPLAPYQLFKSLENSR